MPRKEDERVPGAMEALDDDEARRRRSQHAEGVKADALKEFGVEGPANPKSEHPELPDHIRPGLPPRPAGGQMRPGDEGAPPVIENNEQMLQAVQDPYNERTTKPIPMVNCIDSYNNIVQCPV